MSITFEQVSFSYTPLTKRQKKAGEVQRYALRNVSFTLNDGEFLAIAGHTGSGKSTLVQHLNGLANPTEGRVLWNGKDLADRKNANCARGDIGVVFQYPEHQLFAETVYEDVAFGPRNMGLPEDEVDTRIREALADVHLDFDTLSKRRTPLSFRAASSAAWRLPACLPCAPPRWYSTNRLLVLTQHHAPISSTLSNSSTNNATLRW